MTDSLSAKWREQAATLREFGSPAQAEVLERCAAELDASPTQTRAKALKADAVAELLNVEKQRVYEMIRLGILPAIRMGRQVRVSSAALDAFMRAA